MEMTTNLYKGGIVFFSLQIPQINLRVHFIGDMAQSSSGRLLLLLLAIEVKYFSFGVQKEKKEKLDKMVKKYEGTPEELAKELSDIFGVEYVE